MKRSSWIVGFLVLLSLFVISGCYTVLRHPTGENVAYEGSYYRTCADCHADASFYHPYYTYGGSHYRWRDYCGYPWWYDNYWWYPYDHDGQEGPEVKRGTGHLWGSSGWPSGGWGFHSPSSGESSDPPTQPPSVRRPLRIRPTERTKAKQDPPKEPPKGNELEKSKKEEKKPDRPIDPKPERPQPAPARPTPNHSR